VTENKERFVLYEYLSFFWKKKWLFVILPIVALLIGALLSMLQSANYTGKAIVYTGDVRGIITDPEYAQDKYGKLVSNNSLEVKVDQQDQVTFIVKGDDEDEVKEELKTISSKYYKALKQKAKVDIDVTKEGIKMKEERETVLKQILPAFVKLLEQGKLDEEELTRFLEYDYNLKEVTESIKRMNEDIKLYEHPQVIKDEVNQDPKHLRTNMLLGFVAGIFLTILTLIVWKYIVNARRFYKHD
jgi:capsular polysaccharide biosynthesis protein